MRANICVLLLSILLTSCSIYSPVQYIGGTRHPANTKQEICTHYALRFPIKAKNSTLVHGMEKLNIQPSQVYSVERSVWPYMLNIYGQNCLHFYMNSTYTEPAVPPEKTPEVAKPTPRSPPPPMLVVPAHLEQPRTMLTSEGSLQSYRISGSVDSDLTYCEQHRHTARTNCRKSVFKYYENLGKKEK